MHALDPPFDAGGRSLRDRLRGLCRSLEDVAGRLRESVARVVSQTVADVVQDAVRDLWARLVAAPPLAPRLPDPKRHAAWRDSPEDGEDAGGWNPFGKEPDE